jgi:hypothetical protein
MSKHSEEFYREVRARIRKLLQVRPNATGKEVAKVFDLPYIMSLRELNKVRRGIVQELRQVTQESDLADYAEFVMQASPEIKHIIFDRDAEGKYLYSAKERIFAFEALIKGQDRLLNVKMDLGQYQRNIGKIQVQADLTPEQNKLLEKALNYATERANRAGDNSGEGGQKI